VKGWAKRAKSTVLGTVKRFRTLRARRIWVPFYDVCQYWVRVRRCLGG